MKRVVLERLKYNTDLLEGLRQAVKDEKITNAVILSGVGSVTRFHVHAVSNTTLPAKLAYSEHAGPMDLIAVNGYVLGGRIHAHITMTDDQKALADTFTKEPPSSPSRSLRWACSMTMPTSTASMIPTGDDRTHRVDRGSKAADLSMSVQQPHRRTRI